MLKLAALAAGSWKFWLCSALAATISIVIYKEIHGTPSEVGSYRYQTLGRERALLMNVDNNTTCKVTFESYAYNETASLSNRRKYESYWTWVEEDSLEEDGGFYNLKDNPCTELHVSNNGRAGDRLWSLLHCRHGNTHSSDAEIQKVSNYLPHSLTSVSIEVTGSTAANDDTAGQIVMQNTKEAQVISSCYPEGIGTVYFDAVNAFVGYLKGKIAVDVAYGVWKTNSTGKLIKDLDKMKIPDDLERDADGNFVPPDDAHCDEVRLVETTESSTVTETTPFARVAWVRAKLTGQLNANGAFTHLPTNDVVELKMATGNSSENFYRVWAPIADLAVNPDLADYARGPMRFRLKRLDRPQDDPDLAGLDEDGILFKGLGKDYEKLNALLLVDNVIASYPAMKAWAIPAGEYVNGGSARNVIGWTGVVSTNYPAVGMTGLKATAGLSIATNAPAGVSVDGWMDKTEASLTWRWRYMDQAIGAWEDLPLAMQPDGTLASATPMALPQAIGDVELRYVTTLDAPYYSYLDYSGSTKISGTPGYSERIRKVSSQLNPEARGAVGGIPLKLPSRGTDFFFRLRCGASEQLEYKIEVCKPDSSAILMTAPCWLTADNTWKAYLKTTTNATSVTALTKGNYRFRIRGVKPEVSFKGETAMTQVPWSAQRLVRTEDPEAAWTAFTVDSATDALMFQIVEDPAYPDEMTYTVVHASFQDFNSWADAVPDEDIVYTGAFFEGRGKQSGSSPDAREYPCELNSWNPLSAQNAQYWTENFQWAGHRPQEGYDGHKAYKPFTYSTTPNGWEAIASMWVCSKWRDQFTVVDGDMALQLGGFGDGFLDYSNTAEMPHGINEVNFKARIARSLAFEDFAYYFGGALTGYKDYVFSTRAIMATSDASTEFDGNGSISLVGYYQPGTGCYELRAERIGKDTIRLYLYKWSVTNRTVKATMIGYHNTDRTLAQTRLKCDNDASTDAKQKSGYFGNLFMRCQTVDGQAKITGGVMTGNVKLDGSINTTHYVLTYTDQDPKNKLTYGAFGFASVSCPAWIINPTYYKDGNSGTFPSVSGKPIGEDGKSIDKTYFRCGSGTVTFPGGGIGMFSTKSGDKYANWAYSDWDYESLLVATLGSVKALPPSGEVALYVNDGAEPVTNMTVNGFQYNDLTARVRNTADSLITITTGAESDDIVIDNVSFDQWSAGSYDDPDNDDFEDKLQNFGSPTNFVYVNGWVRLVNGTQHVIDLQPMRAVYETGFADYKAVSVRSPLMDGREGRGKGLGLLSYTYRDADPRCRILVQYRDDIDGTEYLNSYTKNPANWKTVATNDFSTGDYDLKGGTITTYIGAHGAKGAMRLIVDPQVVRDARSTDAGKNPGKDPAYGQITITDFRATDEPALDGMCWWGWNLRTSEDPMELSLVDSVEGEAGLALALNNSVTDQTESDPGESDEDCKKRYAQNLPFVQTPTFYTNLINEVSFTARRMTEADPITEVAILGAKDGGVSEQTEWKWLKTIVVDSVSYETYSHKVKANDGYRSFRIAVIGVKDVEVNHADKMEVPPPPPRILIDEVSVSEGVYGDIGFFDVGAFRRPLEQHVYIDPGTNLFEIAQQPMCEESWTVQCEVRKTQLKEEILLDDETEVSFHWYRGEKWGYENWKDDPAAKSAPLARIRDQAGFVYRGSYPEASGAIVEPGYKSGEVVQFMLVARYKNADGTWADPRPLKSGEWTKPAWYRGVDYNATRGGGAADRFAAYTILDMVAYGYAWINEVNFYDGPSSSSNTARTNQYVEVAMPAEASLERWKLQFITGGLADDAAFYTNTVAVFRPAEDGTPGVIPPQKPGNRHMDEDSGYVFLTACSPYTLQANPGLKTERYVDGAWQVGDDFYPYQEQLKDDGTVSGGYPIGVRLVRPSGIIEDEIVVIGTNIYARLGEWEAAQHSPTNFVNRLRKAEKDDGWYFVGEDDGSRPTFGRSVTNQFATSEGDWAYWPQTPGRINACGGLKQYIASEHPRPYATMLILYANLENGHIVQSYGEYTNVAENLVLYIPKGLKNGTNIVYEVADWHEIEAITETVQGKAPKISHVGDRGRFECTVAVDETNDTVRLVASTRVRSDLVDQYGLDPVKNPYANAVVAWLEGNATSRGGGMRFKVPGGAIELARLEGLDGVDRGEMNLTDMYWFDMDPTWAGQVFRMGLIEAPSEKPVGGRVPYEDDDGSGGKVTNLVMQVFMMISNRVDETFEPYAPYTLNGRKPGSSSAVDSSDWDSETFKITGIVNNGTSAFIPASAEWLPLRYFVFGPDSFRDFRATIEIMDPFSPPSPAYYQGWDVLKGKPAFFSFSIDTRVAPVTPEVLNWDSTLP